MWDVKTRKRLVLLQGLAVLMAVFQYGQRATGQEKGGDSNRILSNFFHPSLTARIPLAGSAVGEWLAATARMNLARIRVRRRRTHRRYRGMPLRKMLPLLIRILCTTGIRTARGVWCYCSLKLYLYQLILRSVPFHRVTEYGRLVNQMLLMISGDIESNPGPRLGISDLDTVYNETFPCRAKWYTLGILLRVDMSTLPSINVRYSDPGDLLREVLKTWLTTSENPTWGAMVEALKRPAIGEARLAMKLQRRYCSSAQPPLDGTALTLRTVFSALHSVSHKWFSIGLRLDVPVSRLKLIETDRQGVQERMLSMLNYWLNNATVPSWKALVDALRALGESRLAYELEERYCSPEDHSLGTTLTMRTVFSALHSVQHKWYSIGLQLGVAEFQLKLIEAEIHSVERQMVAMLDHWLAYTTVPSWKALVDALKAPTVGEGRLAKELEERYCSPVDHSSLGFSHRLPVQGSLGYLLAASGDPSIQVLVGHLPQNIQDRKVDSESLGYVYQIAKWKQWADTNPGMSVFPVKPSHFYQYLTHLVDSDGHEAAVADVSKAMTWVHNLADCTSPITDPRVGTLLTQLQEIRHQLDVCDRMMKDKETLEFTLMQCMFIGLPRAGKSSLMRRLMGEQPLTHSASTGVLDEAKKVILRPIDVENAEYATVQVSGMVWEKLMLDDEAVKFLQDMVRSFQSPNLAESDSSAPNEQETDSRNDSDTVKENMASSGSTVTQTQRDQDYAPMDPFKEALKNKKWDIAKRNLEDAWTLYLTDTGGQPEFQEVLPALISGPTVFVIVFNLSTGLDEKFEVKYVRQSGVSSKPYPSVFTLRNALLKMLAGIACTAQHGGNAKSKVLLVGTHKDQVTQERIKEVDEQLQSMLKETAFYEEGLIEYANRDEHRLLFTVNNLSQDNEETVELRAAIQKIGGKQKGKRYSFKVKILATWLAFYLTLRNSQGRVLPYEECFSIARKCGVETRDELDDALFFLHTRLGVVRHFQVDGLRDIVIKDTQLIFDKITELILETFTFADMPGQDRFEREGFFRANFIEVISQDEHLELFTSSKLVQLLKHLNIIAPLENHKGDLEYFMPCVLKQVNPQQSIEFSSSVASLVFRFNCGYCPMGLYSALAVYLTQNKMNSLYDWELKQNLVFKNHIEFKVGPYKDVVTLTAEDSHFAVSVTQAAYTGQRDRSCKLDILCCEVRACVEKGVSEASAMMHYKCNATYRLGFYCNCAPKYPEDHIAIIQDENLGVLECLAADTPCEVLSKHRVWLSQSDQGDCAVACDPHVPVPQATGAVPEPVLKELVTVKVNDWYNLGLQLDIDDDDLQTIKRDNPRDENGCKRDMFRTWLRICPQASYRQLVQALVALGDVSEADRLCKKHGIDTSCSHD